MKKLISILMVALMLLLCAGCESSDTSSSNYSSTYSSMPSLTVPSSIPSFDFDFEFEEDDYEYSGVTVYVSKSGKIHNNPRCSGMKYYTEMDYDEAVENGYDFCMNCY